MVIEMNTHYDYEDSVRLVPDTSAVIEGIITRIIKEKNLNYCIKFNESGFRKDSIIVYSFNKFLLFCL